MNQKYLFLGCMIATVCLYGAAGDERTNSVQQGTLVLLATRSTRLARTITPLPTIVESVARRSTTPPSPVALQREKKEDKRYERESASCEEAHRLKQMITRSRGLAAGRAITGRVENRTLTAREQAERESNALHRQVDSDSEDSDESSVIESSDEEEVVAGDWGHDDDDDGDDDDEL